ncbi:MAG TPA: hypothetical protein VKU85_09000, partial [bacterium]|nr:hypothetical protein [bacterium]
MGSCAAAVIATAVAGTVAAAVAMALAASPAHGAPAERPKVDPETHPLTQVPKGRSTGEQVLRFPAWVAERPFWLLGRGLEGTLTWVEQKEIIQKIGNLPGWLRRNHLVLGPSQQGTGTGTGLVVGTFAGVGHGMVMATTDWTAREYQRHELLIRTPLSRSVGITAFGRFDRRARDNFYGFGQSTKEEDRTQYSQDAVSAGLALGWRMEEWTFRVEGGWADSDPLEDPFDDEHPSTLDEFPGLPGADGAKLVSVGGRMGRGALNHHVEAAANVYYDADDDVYGFNRYELTIYHAVPVFRGDRMLAFRLHGVTTEPRDDRSVPFWMLPEISARNGLRAYDAWRFRDLDAVVMNVEYRFPIWDIGLPSGAGVDAVLFFDAGRVSPALEDDLIWREFKSDAG